MSHLPLPSRPPSSSPSLPSSNTILHTRPEEAFRFFGASWRAGSGRRRWKGSRLNIVTKKADTQLVPGTTEFFRPPHPYHLVSTSRLLLAARLPCLFWLAWMYLVPGFPSARLSTMSTHPSITARRHAAFPVHIADDLTGAPGADAERRVVCARASESAEDPATKDVTRKCAWSPASCSTTAVPDEKIIMRYKCRW